MCRIWMFFFYIVVFPLDLIANELHDELLELVVAGRHRSAEKRLDNIIKTSNKLDGCSVDGDRNIMPSGDYNLTVLHFAFQRQVLKWPESFVNKLIKHLSDECITKVTLRNRSVLHYAAQADVSKEQISLLINRLRQAYGVFFNSEILERKDRSLRYTAFDMALMRKRYGTAKELIGHMNLAKLTSLKSQKTKFPAEINQKIVESIEKWKKVGTITVSVDTTKSLEQKEQKSNDSEQLEGKNTFWEDRFKSIDLRVRLFSDFKLIKEEIGGSGGGKYKALYQDLKSPNKDKYIINTMPVEGGEPALLEAYAGIIYKFLLGSHSSSTQFIENKETNELYAGLYFEDSFKSADEYFMDPETWKPLHKLLPEGKGLGPIIVASALLGEIDLKGMGHRSNLGVIKDHKEGLIFYKIDHGQSFNFNQTVYVKYFDLSGYIKPKNDAAFLKRYGLHHESNPDYKANPFEVTQGHLKSIASSARLFATVPDNILIKILDFAEYQLRKNKYPKMADDHYYEGYQDERLGGSSGVFKGKFPKGFETFKEAILQRFRELRDLVSK